MSLHVIKHYMTYLDRISQKDALEKCNPSSSPDTQSSQLCHVNMRTISDCFLFNILSSFPYYFFFNFLFDFEEKRSEKSLRSENA